MRGRATAVWYTATTSGTYRTSIVVGGVAIAGSPFDLVVHPAPTSAPSSTSINGAAKTSALHTALVTARDAFGNRQERGGDYFVARVGGGAYIDALVTDNLNSTYTVSWTPPVPGIYLVYVTLASGDAGCCGLTGKYYTNKCVEWWQRVARAAAGARLTIRSRAGGLLASRS